MQLLNIDGKKFRLGELVGEGSTWAVPVDDKRFNVEVLEETMSRPSVHLLRVGGKVIRVEVERRDDRDAYLVEINGRPIVARLEEEVPLLHGAGAETIEGPALVTSPMAGKIASVKALIGTIVEEGQALVVLEAMKMENEIAAPKKGTVKEIYVQQGSLAKPGDKLVLIE
jgi:biotin carboxyl carrier protein